MTRLEFIGNDMGNKFDQMFLSKIPFKFNRHFENQWAVFGTSQPAQKRLLTTLRSTVAPSISLILTEFTCYPILFSLSFVLKNTFYSILTVNVMVHSGKQVGKNPVSKSRIITIFLCNHVLFIPGNIMIPFIDILDRTKKANRRFKVEKFPF